MSRWTERNIERVIEAGIVALFAGLIMLTFWAAGAAQVQP